MASLQLDILETNTCEMKSTYHSIRLTALLRDLCSDFRGLPLILLFTGSSDSVFAYVWHDVRMSILEVLRTRTMFLGC